MRYRLVSKAGVISKVKGITLRLSKATLSVLVGRVRLLRLFRLCALSHEGTKSKQMIMEKNNLTIQFAAWCQVLVRRT